MVVMEFLRDRVAPLQRHEHGLWDLDRYTHMSLGKGPLEDDVVCVELNRLVHTGIVVDLLEDVLPLYRDPRKASVLEGLPEFDGQGILNSAPMSESSGSELPTASVPSAAIASHQDTKVEGDGESRRTVEEVKDPRSPSAQTVSSSTTAAGVGPQPRAGRRTPLSTGWVSEASDENGFVRPSFSCLERKLPPRVLLVPTR
jgi:hypothetical protein